MKCSNRWNRSWLVGCTSYHFGWMLRETQLLRNVYLVKDGIAAHPEPRELPWYVVLALGTHSKKHIFQGSTLPRAKELFNSGKDVCRKLVWAWHHRGTVAAPRDSLRVMKLSPAYHKVAPPEFAWCSTELQNRIGEAFCEANQLAKASCPHRTTPGCVSSTRRWLKEEFFTAALSDKDGVFCLIRNSDYNDLLCTQLGKRWYTPVFQSTITARQLQKDGLVVCKKLARTVDRKAISEMRARLFIEGGTTSCAVLATIKTHKPLGDLSCRLIHSSSMHIFGGLTRYIAKVLAVVCKKMKHCCLNSRSVIEQLKETEVSEGTILVKLDVKDFYMDSQHPDCLSSCRLALEDHVQENGYIPFVGEDSTFNIDAFMEGVTFILYNQYVDPKIEGVLYKVICGSGMGMDHSPFLSSINFYQRVEKSLINNSRCMHSSDSIQFYCRYHDDIFMACKSTSDTKTVLAEFADLAVGNYRLEVEAVSNNGVQMLDIFIFKKSSIVSTRRLSYSPFVKPTSRHIPLGQSSAHAPFVHRSWPIGEMRRLHSLSQDAETFELFKSMKLSRFASFDISQGILEKCRAWNPPIGLGAKDTSKCNPSQLNLRIIIPYHRALACVLPKYLASISKRFAAMLQSFWPAARNLQLQIAWRNDSKPLHVRLRGGS